MNLIARTVCVLTLSAIASAAVADEVITVGPRPMFLVDSMKDGALKTKLRSCAAMPITRKLFSIGHRGAPMQFPEHTRQSYVAAARMGAGILECDVTFTKDKELVCRHAQNDLHTTTNILASDLASTCTKPFIAASGDKSASAECRTSELSLAEFKTLTGKMDAADKTATTVEDYMNGTANWRTDLYAASSGDLMTHAESIELFRQLGAKFTPELKSPSVEMPFDGFSQADYAQKLIDEYKAAGVPAADVWPQSFNLDDVLYWIKNEPEFGAQAVYLDGRYDDGLKPDDAATFKPSMQELADMGVRYLAPPMWMLVTVRDGKIAPSEYAAQAKAAGLKLITWTIERSGPLMTGGGWYYQSIKDVTDSDGVMYELIDVLAKDVGVVGIFSDWPATVTYYANCLGLE